MLLVVLRVAVMMLKLLSFILLVDVGVAVVMVDGVAAAAPSRHAV